MRKVILPAFCLFALLFTTCGAWAAEPEPAGTGDGKIVTIKVSNSHEFLEALGSNRIIEMDAGEYNLSDWDPYSANRKNNPKLASGVTWQDIYDEGELVLNGIQNLTIKGRTGQSGATSIIIEPRSSFVLQFENCSNIEITGLTAGHSEGGVCRGGVFGFDDSSRITINNTKMYGCGTVGLRLNNVSGMKVTNSEIYECTYRIIITSGGKNIAFENCTFRGNQEFDLILVFGTENMSFSNCRFTGNRGQDMFAVRDTTVRVSDSAFSGNDTDSPIQDSDNVEFVSCKFK